MPVEIRELHIRVTIQSEAGRELAAQQATPAQPVQTVKDSLIEECVEQVLAIIQSKKER